MRIFILFLLLWNSSIGFSNKTSSEIYVHLQKFSSLKKVLYIAAHPDDENTRALAYFSLGEHAQTAYLSLTRGDGGQNLIGNELNEVLGILRTQELLAARSYDKAEQYFSKSVDFGYSKSAEESFDKWGKEDLLSDVVLMIRKFKPDIILTRFPADERAGHGHHIASALLALEAFDLAADPDYLPSQVEVYGTWKTKSLYWNSSTWSNPNLEKEAINNPDYLIKDIGGYNELLGMSYNEVGTIARSQHKCQGFGAIIEKGTSLEYFVYQKGEKLKSDFFENKTDTWDKIIDKSFKKSLDQILLKFNFINPEENLKALISLRTRLEKLPDTYFKKEKLDYLNQIILDCIGLDIEVISDDYAISTNDSATFKLQLINRSDLSVDLVGVAGMDKLVSLEKNKNVVEVIKFRNNEKATVPYWLEKPFKNTFVVDNEDNFLKARNEATFQFEVSIKVLGKTVDILIPAEYKWRDPSFGERRRETISAPNFSVNFNQNSIILKPNEYKKVELKIHAFKKNLADEITIEAPKGWKLSQIVFPINMKNKHEELFLNVDITPTEKSERGFLKIKDSEGNYIQSLTEIAYDHIPTQTLFKPASLECIKLDVQINEGKIAYIKGAEDLVPIAIEQLGFALEIFEIKDLSSIDLNQFQSVVLGIRIYNVSPELKNFNDKLFDYVKNGGNLVIQYNTYSRNAPNEKYGGPIPFEITKNRVTEEDAPVKFLLPEHPILNTPNKITLEDFDHWVQERGLYFAGNWDSSYQPILSWSDQGEEEQKGAIIVSNFGKGQIIYTGISFFRLLPAGVEGAYRLFANIISYKHE